jgi:protein CpxP
MGIKREVTIVRNIIIRTQRFFFILSSNSGNYFTHKKIKKMKIKIGLFCIMMLAGVIMAEAQGGGGGMRRTPEERSKRVVDTLTTVFKLDQNQQTQATAVFVDFYKSMVQGISAEDRQKLMGDRDEKLKKVLNADQFKKYKDEIEPAMRQRRGGGGGGNN